MGCLFLFRDAEMTNVTPGVLLESFLFFFSVSAQYRAVGTQVSTCVYDFFASIA